MFLPLALLVFSLLWTVVSAREHPTVFLIRHGEKPANPDDHNLTLDGVRRGQCLCTVFGPESVYNISYIMAPTVKWSESRPKTSRFFLYIYIFFTQLQILFLRTLLMAFLAGGEHGRAFKTVRPLATDLGLKVDTHCSRNKAECVADSIRDYSGPGNILIAWRHKNIPDIQVFLGSEDPLEYPDDR